MTGDEARPRIRHNDYSPVTPAPIGRWNPELPVSVIIPAHGGQHRLDLVLASLAAQSYPAPLTEVIVVDDGSSPPLRLPEIRPENTRLIQSPPDGRGAGHAMNAGIAVAEGEVVQRLDADMVIHREHLEALLRWQHLTDYLVTFGGKKFVTEPPLRPGEVFEAVGKGELESLFADSELVSSSTEETVRRLDGLRASRNPYQTCTGPTVSLRRTLLDKVRGFDPAVVRGQDTEFAYRLAQEGAVFVPDFSARAVHLGLPAQRGEHREAIVRLVETYLAHQVPLRRDLRKEWGRGWAVPYVEIVLDVSAGPGAVPPGTAQAARAAISAALGGTVSDVRISLVGPWSRLGDVRVGDPLFDLVLLREGFERDPRVRLVEEIPPSAAPTPFRFTGPLGHPLAPDTLERMTKAMTEERLGMLVVTFPDGGTATLSRTEAVNRARLLASPGEPLESVVDLTHGVRHAEPAQFWDADAADRSARTTAQHHPHRTGRDETAGARPAPKPAADTTADTAADTRADTAADAAPVSASAKPAAPARRSGLLDRLRGMR
ncbi:glycosyltransferase [Microtetraspora sp. NBRC 16547]|uniref:glycosyltransferase n=1 Tax=Microtetraspora sp. NBRC 16547 TaxID=3030993 RepID=UPI0024A36736|nr:glycosyltransferase [Microtetraspora sp. NBRC 16547]GLX00098.1 hypothetical protein Misp02_41840 [Microtetraspora sp. NBRC 16547]